VDAHSNEVNAYGHIGGNQYTSNSKSFAIELSPQELAYLQAHEDEIKRNQRISATIIAAMINPSQNTKKN
jgi:hypothetical protein